MKLHKLIEKLSKPKNLEYLHEIQRLLDNAEYRKHVPIGGIIHYNCTMEEETPGNPYCNVPECHRNYHHEHYYTVLEEETPVKHIHNFMYVNPKFCKCCGEIMQPDDNYCPQCGKEQ